MRLDIFSIFPEVFEPYFNASIMQRARQRQLVEVHLHDIRQYTNDRHHTTDDEPYGGGGGMVMKPEPIFAAVESVLGSPPSCPLILLSPQGRLFTQKLALEFAQMPHVALLCGRYEGIDERVRIHLVSDEVSIGDYVLTGGELAALVFADAMVRAIPGVLGDPDGVMNDSHASGLLEYPHYTRPAVFCGWQVPEVLLSGDHARIARWRREQSLLRTQQCRPDMLTSATLSESDLAYLADIKKDNTET